MFIFKECDSEEKREIEIKRDDGLREDWLYFKQESCKGSIRGRKDINREE